MHEDHPEKLFSGIRWVDRLRPLWKLTRQEWWTDNRLKVITFFWLVAFVTGVIGFSKQSIQYGQSRSWSDLVYQTLQLPLMQSGLLDKPVNGWLDFARFFAPIMTLVTGLQALALLLGERLQVLRLRHFCRDHTIICGLGRRGALLAEQFRAAGQRCVLIEHNEKSSSMKRFRDEGTLVITGDAEDRNVLKKARVDRASRIVCVCADDETNAQICANAWELMPARRRKPVTCLVHIVSTELCELLRLQMIKRAATGGFRVEFFNIFHVGAWALLDQYPIRVERHETRLESGHLVVVGLGRFGTSVLLQVAKMQRAQREDLGGALKITVIDKDAERKVKALRLSHPTLQTVCQVVPLSMDLMSPEFEEGTFLSDEQGIADASQVYVCLGDQGLGLRVALSLHERIRRTDLPIVVRMKDARGLSALLSEEKGDGARFRAIRPFNLFETTCNINLVHGVTNEVLARAIHGFYLEGLKRSGVDLGDKPAAVPWEQLPEHLRESNRRQADHVGKKLDAVGCSIAPLHDWDADLFRFTSDELETLARMEHQRWWDERISDGWKPGPRDDNKKRHPDMVPWERLSEELRDLDRQVIQDLPRLMASIDLQIYRIRSNETVPAS